IAADLAASIQKMKEETGEKPWMVTWPFGKFNLIGQEEAQPLGLEMILTLESGPADIKRLNRTNRNMVFHEMGIAFFIASLQKDFDDKARIRAAQIDLDLIVNPLSYEESDQNLGRLIERLVALGVNTVFLQGFCDTEGSGNIRSVYFPNTVFPVKMDFLSHAVHQIKIRDIKTYVWMPALSWELEDKVLNESLKVREMKNGHNRITTSWYRRLSPFDPQTLPIVKSLYRDLAAHVDFDGLLFQDDLYLTDEEDFHPSALKSFQQHEGVEFSQKRLAEKPFREQWIRFKTRALNDFTREIMDVVRRYRPAAEFARNIYSEVVLNPSAQEWFSQKLEDFLKIYDYTVLMAYPQMENVDSLRGAKKWLAKLVDIVNRHQSNPKVIFKVQSYDWKKKKWIKDDIFHQELRHLLSLGAQHIGYYPDNVFMNKPKAGVTSAISSKDLP
ncbi:MAG: poly-beta-1,6-N-acetyl-D-glucosamine N-deacetylase PgaB, partial [Deltaproteobacteria bacterium]|nr:poly-beta-1,6-N-acetyl-D-glucosamine N-deacetylase PgaB [Deltaproteobacteria bacterium]